MNNFGMLRYEVMDAMTTSNLEDILYFEEKSEETSGKDWDKMNRTACGVIRFYLTKDNKHYVMYETFARKIWEILERKYLTKNIET